MYNRQIFSTGLALTLLVLCTFGPGAARAGPITYQVTVSTSAISGQVGNLDFQFNPGGSSAKSASATVTHFQTLGGVLASSPILTGDASGSLPGTLMLNNDTAYNDVFQGFTYGSSIQFNLTLSGMAIDSPGGAFGSSFALSLYDTAGITPLLTTDPNASVLTVNLKASGTTSVVTFPQSQTNSTPAAVAISAVPEPSSLNLLVSVLPIIVLAWSRLKT